ncbi:alpha/beta hydrolase [Crateriforma conspicua]|uniref:alpha/beta hydrolase n=1 Tax=Crateriforma conspicua TaxID=2527996 RepID=UPI00118C93B2|nr:alpha/beta hydrolase [Crateriforma conspicua]QDV62645.1 hypothetical protein Mal65_17790 [Crateriforma conspicua]
MFADFELSFAYWKGLVRFSLFRNGLTEATHKVEWNTIKPRLTALLERTEAFDDNAETPEHLIALWAEMVKLTIGEEACRVIVDALPARLTIAVQNTVPASHHDLFRVAPWDITISMVGGLSSPDAANNVLDDNLVTVVDVRIAEEGHTAASVGGVENVPASMDYRSGQDDEEADGTLFPVWFGSNRQLYQDGEHVFERPESAPSNQVKFGKCEVWIPKTHRRGEQKSPWYRPDRWLSGETLQIRNTQLIQDLVGDICGQIQQSTTTNHLLFIHGFNNSFQDAILRAAQVGFDLGINGATIAFSWPSRKLLPFVSRYNSDGDAILASRKALASLAEHIGGLEGTLHVIAHSMGNRALSLSWKEVFEAVNSSESLKIGQVVFAAPDVFQTVFKNDTENIEDFCQRATLYANRTDFALGLSRLLNRWPRAGVLPPVMSLDGIDTIEVPFNLALFGHTYFAKLIPMLEDLSSLIETNADPDGQSGRSLHRVDETMRHWRLSGPRSH